MAEDADRNSSGLMDTLTPDIDSDSREVSTYLFAADKAAPRRRRTSDIIRFGVTAVLFGLFGWAASGDPAIDARVLELTDDLPGWMLALGWVGYTGAFLVMLGLLVVMLARGGIGRGVLRDFLVTIGLILGLTLVVGRLVSGDWPSVVPEFQDDYHETYPTMRTAVVLGGTWVLSPYVTAFVQRVFRWTAIAAIFAPFLLALTTVTHLGGAIALAAGAVAGVRMLFGSPEGLPPIDRLNDTLLRAGVQTEDLAYLDEQPGTVGLATARVPGSDFTYTIKIYGEDSANRQRGERMWRAMWYRKSGPTPRAGRVEQAQSESLAMLTCRVSGVSCPELITSGQDVGGDVVVVSIDPGGQPVGGLDPERVDDELIGSLWAALRELHKAARIAHGNISPDTIWVDDEGTVSFVDLVGATTMPTEQQLAGDMAALLATTAILAGTDATIVGATAHLDHKTIEASLPYLQDAAIDPDLRRDAKRAGFKIADLRSGLSEKLEVEEPELVPMQRVSWSQIIMLLFALIAANALLTQIADVGWDTIVEEFRNASTGWLVAAFVIKILGYSTAYFGLRAVVPNSIPFMPTTFLQSAKSYVGLVVPSTVGRVGLDIRFLQKQGVPTTVAASQGPVISLTGFGIEVILLLLTAWVMGQSVDTDDLEQPDVSGVLFAVILIVVIGLVVVFGVKKYRNKVMPVIKDALGAVRSMVSSPRTMLSVFSSELGDRLIGALALGATCVAFGVHLNFAALVFVSVGTGLLAGLAPVPGGIGVAEATMSALLTAVGVDPELSLSIAIIHRFVTSYTPPVLGYFALNWLTDEDYL